MEHVRIATYSINEGTFQQVADVARNGMLHTFQQQPGFIRYGLADAGDKTCVSISLWSSRSQADAATGVAATWVRENLADRVELKSNTVGDLAFFEGALARV